MEPEYYCPSCNEHTLLVVDYTNDKVVGCGHCDYGKNY